jgi:hypothetical protein
MVFRLFYKQIEKAGSNRIDICLTFLIVPSEF